MEFGEFTVTGLESVDESPGPSGQALVIQPAKEPMPNALTVEGMIAGVGLMAQGAVRQSARRNVGMYGPRRRNKARLFIFWLSALFLLPPIIGLVVDVARLIF